MEVFQVTIDDEIRTQLDSAKGRPVELRARDGQIVGYCVTPEQMAWVEQHQKSFFGPPDSHYAPEDLARIAERMRTDTRPKRTMEEAFRLVEGS